MTRAFDTMMAGLLDALAYAHGEPNGCVVHEPKGLFAQLSPEQQKQALEQDDGL